MTRTRPVAGLVAIAAGAVILILGIASCGGGQSSHRHSSGPFAWLHAASAPPGWNLARTATGAVMPYPPGYKAIKTDPGTASVALLGSGNGIRAYLNATPKQSTETLANWSRFRPAHNRDEGIRDVRVLASSSDLTFRSGRGSCVSDTYTTSKARYREIACLVSGTRSSGVIVAAAQAAQWNRYAATLHRAVSTFKP